MKRRLNKLLFSLAVIGFSVAPAHSATTGFDSFEEGFLSLEFTDGGIRFYDAYDYAGSQNVFAIDDASQSLDSSPFFSGPNIMSISGLVPGPQGEGGFFFTSFRMELANAGLANYASIDLFINSVFENNELALLAFLGSELVASSSISGPIFCCDFVGQQLSIEGAIFDSLQLITIGTGEFSTSAAGFDNVIITPVPLPAGLVLFVSATFLLRKVSKRKQ